MSPADYIDAWQQVQHRKRQQQVERQRKMAPELTRGLLESIEYAAQQLTEQTRTLHDSHHGPEGWDDPKRGVEAAAARLHTYRLECFARSLAVVLRREERKREAIQRN